MVMDMEYYYITQCEIDDMTNVLISQIRESKRVFQGVIGIANGGLHISHKIAEALNLDHSIAQISCYEGQNFRNNIQVGDLPPLLENQLVIDDLIDTGKTFEFFDELYGVQNHAIAVLFWQNGSFQKPDFFVKEKPPQWIVFPWELENA